MKKLTKRIVSSVAAAILSISLIGCSAQDSSAVQDEAVAEAENDNETSLDIADSAQDSSANLSEEGTYTPGTYTGTAAGRNGDIVVLVTTDSDSIIEVVILEQEETAGVADGALEEIPATIVEAQSANVDAVSGATITSNAIMQAAAEAIALAAGDEAEEAELNTNADVLVLGAGGAGLSAGSTAASEGASVIILEANTYAGGATLSSGGHMLYLDEEYNAAQERNDEEVEKYLDYDEADFPDEWGEDLKILKEQVTEYLNNGEEMGRFDSIERVMVDHYALGYGTDPDGNAAFMDYDLVRAAVEENMVVYEWLAEDGMTIQDTLYKDHANSPVDSGAGLVNALVQKAENAGCEIHYSTRAISLVTDGERVTGVIAQLSDGTEVEYTANKGVVIATGGYSANASKVAEYQTLGEGLSENVGTSNPSTNQGDGIWMAQEIGAAVTDLQFIMTVMMGYHGGSTLSEAGQIMGTQQLVVNAEAVRFVDESTSSEVQSAMNDETDGLGYLVGDAKMIEALDAISEGFTDDLVERGWVYVADTLAEAAELAGLDPDTLENTVAVFNSYVDSGVDEEFGRESFNGKVEEGPYIIAKMEMHYHLTFGGLIVDEDMHVLTEDGLAIEGLYAAGDVLSGFEGTTHQSGDCLSVVVTSGRIAGIQAALGE